MSQKGFAPILILLGIILISGIAYGGYYFGSRKVKLTEQVVSKNNKAINLQITPTVTSNNQLPISSIAASAFPTPTLSSTPLPLNKYTPGKDWQKINHPTLGSICLPSKWEFDKLRDGSLSTQISFNRDPAYRPTVAYIQDIPYSSGSLREAYYKFWGSEYPNVRQLVAIKEISIGSNTVLTITSGLDNSQVSLPDGNLAVVWYANNKLWKAGLSSWNMVNDSQSAFLKDFYTAINCNL